MAAWILESLLQINQTCFMVLDQLSRYNSINDSMQILKVKLEELRCLEADVNKELEYVELKQGKKRKREVGNWLRNVESKKNEVHAIDREVRGGGLLVHLKLGKRVEKLTREVAELVERGRFHGGLMLSAQDTRGDPLLATKLVGKMFHINMDKIWEWLVTGKVLSIGVYGMGGVGKTTLVTHIHNQVLARIAFFDDVFWVSMSQGISIRKLQNDIAKTIGLNLSKEDDGKKRAAKLSQALMKRKQCVLILDDVWNHFHLEKVGIPLRVNGCKLILTSRSLDVCRRIGCQKNIKVKPLSEEEAWVLFLQNLGNHVTLPPVLINIARSIAKECAALPLGIITMARNMRGVEDISEWRYALEELRKSEVTQGEMEMEVYRVLRFSYARLNNEILQHCFLYCALYPNDFEIERDMLIESFLDEQLIKGMKNLGAAFDEGHTIINKLENNCLLEKVENYIGGNKCMRLHDSISHIAISMMKGSSRYMTPIKSVEGYFGGNEMVKMHDLVRAMAISVIRDSRQIMVKAGLQLTEIPGENEWTEDLEKVSLMRNWIREIPSGLSPKCPKLRTLILKYNESLTWISHSFFSHMSALMVLDLSFTDIENLPNSVSDLKTLTALLLSFCKRLRYVPSLAKLQALVRLDLSHTAITEVPHGMEMLINLRWLNLYTKTLKLFPGSIIAKLNHLQFLILHWSSGKIKVKVEDIVGLKMLETFAGNLHDLPHFNAISRTMQIVGPKNYLLQLGTGEHLTGTPRIYFMEVCLSKDVIITGCGIREGEMCLELPVDIQRLKIEQCRDVKSLCDILSLKNASSLRRCEIGNCDGQEYLFSLSCSSSCCTSLQNLESLELYNLRSLHALCKEDEAGTPCLPSFRSFSSLRYFCIYHCHNIKKLLTPGLLTNLQNLEEITVHHCNSMKEIISVTAVAEEHLHRREFDESSSSNLSVFNKNDVTTFTHKKLVSLSLKYLPELESICGGLMVCHSLQNFRIFKCPKLKRLPQTIPSVQILLYDSF
ncbi:Disease resistance protein [Quillaja saponaria]|uniref:Disease resistance protein n=1 Tax=Quillaja saponaria TaxID=32244 RepID=A0AAD7PAZ9_QUISA|nr:Disease resistance protein [Quillaja saponaria]